ncbi:MAG: leucine-rich repeat domain-containing protein [Candidatus Thorarchaeota archaeon]
MTRCIVVRYTDTTNPDDQRFLYGPSEPTSHVKFVSSDLNWVQDIKNLVRLDISCNYLSKLDLSALEECKTLKYLDLSENGIESIDLSPLRSCKKLETLDLSYNRLTDVDFLPLAGCKSLRYLYIHRNQLDTVNIAPLNPLVHLQKVIIDTMSTGKPVPVYKVEFGNPPPNLNDILYAMTFKTSRPAWLEGAPQINIIKMHAESYKKIVESHGWDSVRKHLAAAHSLLPTQKDFIAQKEILGDLGMPELACYDGSISDLIELVPTTGTYEEGVETIRTGLISLLMQQLENEGSTLFFDIDRLSTTSGSVLVPQIVSQREIELKAITLYQYNDRVNLMPMWLTGFGFNILQAVGCGREERRGAVPDILGRSTSALGIEIPLKRTQSKKKFESLGSSPSKPLLEHILSIVSS